MSVPRITHEPWIKRIYVQNAAMRSLRLRDTPTLLWVTACRSRSTVPLCSPVCPPRLTPSTRRALLVPFRPCPALPLSLPHVRRKSCTRISGVQIWGVVRTVPYHALVLIADVGTTLWVGVVVIVGPHRNIFYAPHARRDRDAPDRWLYAARPPELTDPQVANSSATAKYQPVVTAIGATLRANTATFVVVDQARRLKPNEAM